MENVKKYIALTALLGGLALAGGCATVIGDITRELRYDNNGLRFKNTNEIESDIAWYNYKNPDLRKARETLSELGRLEIQFEEEKRIERQEALLRNLRNNRAQ